MYRTAALCIALALLGCDGVRLSVLDDINATSGANSQFDRDARHGHRLKETREKALATPGNARTANAYTEAVLEGYQRGYFTRYPSDAETHLRDAVSLLGQAAEEHAYEAHLLTAMQGILLMQAGHDEAAVETLLDSHHLQPNWTAGTALVLWYGEQNNRAEVLALCEETLPHIFGNAQRYDFMTDCIEQSGASTIAGGLHWAPEEDVAFYYAEHEHRQYQAAEAAEAAQRREQERRNEELARYRDAQLCYAECNERAHLCMSQCGYNEPCQQSCQNSEVACRNQCRIKQQY